MLPSREPRAPPSVRGVRPALKSMGHVGPGRVHNAADGVGRARHGMNHDDLRLPGNHGVAMGHANGGDFVGYRDGTGQRLFLAQPLGIGFDDGREVGAAVAEEIVDSAGCQQLEVGLGDAFHLGVGCTFDLPLLSGFSVGNFSRGLSVGGYTHYRYREAHCSPLTQPRDDPFVNQLQAIQL